MSDFNKPEILHGSIWQGAIAGLFLPWVAFWCYYLIAFKEEFEFLDFMKMAVQVKLLNPAFSLCLLINLAAFFLSLKSNRLLHARGILGITLIYTVLLFTYKFLD